MKIIKQNLRIGVLVDREWFFYWLKNDYLHREDGPSEVWSDGTEYHHLNSIYYLKHEYWKKVHENY